MIKKILFPMLILMIVIISCEDFSDNKIQQDTEVQTEQEMTEKFVSVEVQPIYVEKTDTTQENDTSINNGDLHDKMLADEEQIISIVHSYISERMNATHHQSGWEYYHPDIVFLYDRHFTYVLLHPNYEISFEIVYDSFNLMEPQDEYLAKIIVVFEKAIFLNLWPRDEHWDVDVMNEIPDYMLTFYISKSTGDYKILDLWPLNDGEKYSIDSLRTVSEIIRESHVRIANELLKLLVQIEEEGLLD